MTHVAEEDYPRTLFEFEKRFSGEEACFKYLEALRWPPLVLFVHIAGVQRLGECLGGFGSVANVESKSRFLRGLFFKTLTYRFKPGFEPCGIFAVRRMA